MNPRIKKIISVKPYLIYALWSNDQERYIDFSRFLSEYFEKEGSIYNKILNEQTFLKAKTDGRTIYWDNIAEMIDYDGKPVPAPLDFCPDVLFKESVLVV
jgi:hypothetical protein